MQFVYGLTIVDLQSIVSRNIDVDLPILDAICLPPYHGPKDHDDFLPLISIAKFVQPHIVVELGTAYGNTVANICKQVPYARVYTVNALAEQQTGTLATYRLEKEEIGRVYRTYGFANRVVQIYQNTLNLDLSEYFDSPVIDLAIIDACHDTDYVINDFMKVASFVSGRGVVLLHDTHPSMKGHLRGSYLACMKLRMQGFDIRHIVDTWWAIWFKQWGC
jgi:hypothetical protein